MAHGPSHRATVANADTDVCTRKDGPNEAGFFLRRAGKWIM